MPGAHHVRVQQLFTSGERDSGVEHLVHVAKVANAGNIVETKQEPLGPSSAMAHRHFWRIREEEARLRRGNDYLLHGIRRRRSRAERERMKTSLLPQNHDGKGFFQGSNMTSRTMEALRIDHDNKQLLSRLVEAKPFTSTSRAQQDAEKHRDLVARISKFRPAQDFAGESILVGRRSPERLPPIASPKRIEQREKQWQQPLNHDVSFAYRAADAAMKGHDKWVGCGGPLGTERQPLTPRPPRALLMLTTASEGTQSARLPKRTLDAAKHRALGDS